MDTRNRIAQEYAAAFGRRGSRAFIANLETTVELHRWGDHLVPLTINNGERAQTFVCSPQVGYVDYCQEELSRFPNPRLVPALRVLVAGVGAVLSWSQPGKIVHINNWMMSTNLPVELDASAAASQTLGLVRRFPDHWLAIRSLTRRYNDPLMNALRATGWTLLPSRQVFLVDDVARECLPRRDTKRDDRIWRRAAYVYEELAEMGAADAERIVELYRLLYRDKYSRLNPDYTAEFVALTHQIGMIAYFVFRDGEGVIQSFGGFHRFGRFATMPLIGYNTHLPQQEGLYRLAFHAGALKAARSDLRFNMSSGAAEFKRHRGATAEMEFTAFYLKHLPISRRLPFSVLEYVAEYVGAPLLRKYRL